MLDLYDELRRLLSALEDAGVDYALCGGLAMAVHGIPRATVDIDLLVPPEALPLAGEVARKVGYELPALPMTFAGGAVVIHRHSKVDPALGDTISVDLVVASGALESVWQGREAVDWEGGRLWVVSRPGLVAMKRLRGSGQDLDDIARLS